MKLDDLVWAENIARELVPAVREWRAQASAVERFAGMLERSSRGIDGHVRRALLDACRSSPVPTVRGLAQAALTCEPRLRAKVRTLFGARPRAASRFLTWVLILSAHDLGRHGGTSSWIAEQLLIDATTLARSVKQMMRCIVRQFIGQQPRLVVRSAVEDLRLAARNRPQRPSAIETRPSDMRAAESFRGTSVVVHQAMGGG